MRNVRMKRYEKLIVESILISYTLINFLLFLLFFLIDARNLFRIVALLNLHFRDFSRIISLILV